MLLRTALHTELQQERDALQQVFRQAEESHRVELEVLRQSVRRASEMVGEQYDKGFVEGLKQAAMALHGSGDGERAAVAESERGDGPSASSSGETVSAAAEVAEAAEAAEEATDLEAVPAATADSERDPTAAASDASPSPAPNEPPPVDEHLPPEAVGTSESDAGPVDDPDDSSDTEAQLELKEAHATGSLLQGLAVRA